MTKPDLPTIEMLHKLLICDAGAGTLYWKERTSNLFANKSVHACKRWNTMFAHKKAFTADQCGYRIGSIFDRLFKAHRVIWAMHYREWPCGEIDHINHDRADNGITNLRVVTSRENGMNKSMLKNNVSGYTGVNYDKKAGKWRASIMVNGKTKHLPVSRCLTQAVIARKLAEQEYGFHHNHGK